jgi:5-methylcytosine-specific restriction endonuclease McrA
MLDELGRPATVGEALGMLDRALDHLNAANAASLPVSIQAETLRRLERVLAKHTAARARALAAFAGQAAYEDDGHGSARTWLGWQTRVTTGAAAGAVGWVRRLAAHPVIGDALAAGEVSESWAKQLCAWTDRLPVRQVDDADEILAGAARAGVDLAGLGGLAQEMYERSHRDRDEGDGFADRAVWLGTTLGGAGWLAGDLTPACSAALSAVLESLGKRAGPEDIRTAAQRRHDALEEACRRLVAAGMLPDRAGQPTQVQLHMTLAQLRDGEGACRAVLARHQHCTHPGCRVPAAYCQIHHYIPRSKGGRTTLDNLGPVCPFHHLIAVHRWGWTLTLHPDGEVTATSPDGARTLRDHDPPSQAA